VSDQDTLKDKKPDELVAEARKRVQNMSLFKISTLVYGAMGAIGLSVIHFGHKNTAEVFAYNFELIEWGRLAAIGGLGAGLLLVLSYFFEDWFVSFRELKALIMRLLGPCSIPMALYLAAISSIGEELLFRGAIQPFIGIELTAILFGCLHIGQDGRLSSWSVWAMIAGVMLGIMTEQTGLLLPAILAHFIVNGVSILNLRRSYNKWLNGNGERPAEPS
jgi:hypothetical protein